MQILIDRSSSVPVYKQIRDQIRDQILSGILPVGFRLPPERKLAEELGVNRSTVLSAYRDLRADDLISSHIGQGTTVQPPLTGKPDNELQKVNPLPWRQFLSEDAVRMQQPLVSNILKMANRTDIISFAAGFSGYSSDPIHELLETQNRLLKDYGSKSLQYSATEGHFPLRESLGCLMKKRGISASPEEIMVLSGSQQGIDIAARILVDPGDIVVVEEPSFFGALQIFQSVGARVMGIPTDQYGMRVDLLEPLLERYKPKLIYTIPTFQNPSGMVMSLERRKKLLQLAYQYQVPILEDDPYGELRYDGPQLPPLKALDQHGYVIYLSTFSKIMFPGLRIGWVVAPQSVIRQYTLTKQMADLHSNSLAQWIMDDFLRRGIFAKRLAIVKQENHQNRDIMADALEQYAIDLEWIIPEGGIYFWCRLPQEVDLSSLISEAEARKIVFVPGNIFYPGYPGQNHIRLSFSATDPEKIKPGIKILTQAVQVVLQHRNSASYQPEIEIRPIL